MVRTSDFQFENVGSNPANPNLLFDQQAVHHILKPLHKPSLSFHFLFASLIPPFISTNINVLFRSTKQNQRILLKNSYLILAWFYYLTSFEHSENRVGTRFFVLPTSTQVYTLTKAPIAHKLWSKEQYKFVFYLLRVSFTNCSFTDVTIDSVSQGLIFILMIRRTTPLFSSNLMTIKNLYISFELTDLKLFNFNL